MRNQTQATAHAPARALYSVKEFARRHSGCLTEGALRALIFHDRDGFATKCVKRIGRKVTIDEGAFYRWLDGQNSGEAD